MQQGVAWGGKDRRAATMIYRGDKGCNRIVRVEASTDSPQGWRSTEGDGGRPEPMRERLNYCGRDKSLFAFGSGGR